MDATPPLDTDQNLSGVTAEYERIKAENVSLRAELAETRANSSRYLQNVAHQLTAPLGAIKWSIEALKAPEVSIERKRKLLSSIYNQATILVHLIKNFALMSNLEADHELGEFRDRPQLEDILRLAINLANDFQPQASEKGMNILVDEESFESALEGKRVRIVKNLIGQAISNLLENAVKYADLRTTIAVTAHPMSFKGTEAKGIAVSVVSTGLPINASEMQRLVERGFRGNGAKQRVPAGTGIGLYLAQRVMQLHQGTLMIKANKARSEFILIFPPSTIA